MLKENCFHTYTVRVLRTYISHQKPGFQKTCGKLPYGKHNLDTHAKLVLCKSDVIGMLVKIYDVIVSYIKIDQKQLS